MSGAAGLAVNSVPNLAWTPGSDDQVIATAVAAVADGADVGLTAMSLAFAMWQRGRPMTVTEAETLLRAAAVW